MNNAQISMLGDLDLYPVKVLCNIHQFATLESLRELGYCFYAERPTYNECSARFAYITAEGEAEIARLRKIFNDNHQRSLMRNAP